MATQSEIRALRQSFSAHGQGHVFRFWEQLTPSDRQALIAQCQRLEPGLGAWIAESAAARRALERPAPAALRPAPAIALPEHGGSPQDLAQAAETGLRLLTEGRVAALVVAGGQGTRLGFPHPKGAYPLGPVTGRSLFALQAQKLRGLGEQVGRIPPWYVMTSPATDAETRALFEASDYFGLDSQDVVIFSQDVVPACDPEGRLLLESPGRIAESPNGHGGALLALADGGALADMAERGIDRIFYYQVDNPLIRMADPVFLGFHEQSGAEMSCKVVRKRDPGEKVGVVATIGGRIGVVEYTELKEPERSQASADGGLAFWAGSIAIHALNTDFVARVRADAAQLLPYHASKKAVPTVNAGGEPVAPTEPNGYKLERFVFDALPAAARVCVVEVRPEEEFSPIKNAEGKDSPDSARRALDRQVRSWLAKAGIEIPEDVAFVEVDHTQIDAENAPALSGIHQLEDAGDLIRVATGMDP